MEPAVIIDGAVPRSDSERCEVVLDHAETLMVELADNTDPSDMTRIAELRLRLDNLRYDVKTPRIIYPGHFTETEDDLIDWINEVLPDHLACVLGEPNPGDVIITDL